MESPDRKQSESGSRRFWERIPVVVQAVVCGYLVFAIAGIAAWIAVLVFIPVPWSMVIMWVVLLVYLKYFSGSGWPKSTSEARAENFRTTKLSGSTWLWSLFTALIIVVVIESSLMVTFRIVAFPADAWDLGIDYKVFPLWQVWLYIILMASVAGITEEVGFRGYMQVPLEKRYGPVKGVILVAIFFMVFHLNQAWAPFVLLHLFAFGTLWGILAYTSGSLIPGMISHIIADIFSFSYWWTDVAGAFNKRPITETGLDSQFFIWLLILFASITLFVGGTRRILASRRSEEFSGT